MTLLVAFVAVRQSAGMGRVGWREGEVVISIEDRTLRGNLVGTIGVLTRCGQEREVAPEEESV